MSDNTTLNLGTGGDIIATDDIGGVKYQRVKVTHGIDGVATDVSASAPLPVTAALGGSAAQTAVGLVAKTTAFGELSVTAPPVPIFFDQFDSAIDTTDRWTLSGTQVPVNTSGAIVLSLGATNSISSVAISQPTFSPPFSGYTLATQLTIGSAQASPNCHRFWGAGVVTSYATATPLTDGFGIEIDLTGALNCVAYISGTRYVVNSTNIALITASGSWAANMTASTYGQTMTWPSTGNATFVLRYVNGTVFFYSTTGSGTTFDVPIGVISYIPAAVILPIRYAAITTAAVSTVLATTFTGSGLVLGGTIGNTIVDSTLPWRGVTIKKASTPAAATDLPMVVALHPSSPTPENITRQTATYSCAVNVAAAAAATDIATITGSATKTVYITKVIISGIQTAAALNDVFLVKRSTADTAGTSTAGVALPHDSANAAGTATILAYTANPTLGTTVATVRRNYTPVAAAASVVNPIVIYDFGERGQELILRGIAQVLAVNLNGATIAGGTFDVTFEWREA